MVIVLLAAVLAYLGGLCSEGSAARHFSFFDVLCVVFVIDALWILSLWRTERKLVLWEWFGLDIAMLILTLGVYVFLGVQPLTPPRASCSSWSQTSSCLALTSGCKKSGTISFN